MSEQEQLYELKESYEKIKEIEKNTKYPKILIGTVTSVHKMYCLPQFMKHLKYINYPNYEVLIVDNSPEKEAVNFCRSMREVGYTVIHHERVKFTRENLIKSRNMIIDYFLRHNRDNPDDQFEYFFSLESDVLPEPDCIQELLKNQVSCVSGVYMNGKVYPPNQQQKHELHTWIPMAWQYPEDSLPELNVLRPMNILTDVVPSRLQRVQSTGLGFVLFHKHVVEKLKKLGGFKVELDSVACFREGTKIQMASGNYKNIEDIEENDMVITHKSNIRRVSAISKRDYNGNMVTIVPYYDNDGVTVTEDHTCIRYKGPDDSVGEKVLSKDIKVGDWVRRPVDTIENDDIPEIEKSETFWETIGYYVGNGSGNGDGKGVYLFFGKHKQDVLEKMEKNLQEMNIDYYIDEQRTSYRIYIKSSYYLAQWKMKYMERQRAHQKKLPQYCMQMPVRYQKAFLKGYYMADGCLIQSVGARGRQKDYRITTVSYELAQQIREMGWRMDMLTSIRKCHNRPEGRVEFIEGRAVNCKQLYDIRLPAKFNEILDPDFVHTHHDNARGKLVTIGNDKYLYIPVKSVIMEESEEPVFNLTVEDDHTVTTHMFSLPQCDDMYAFMDITKMCDNPECDYISDKYIYECPKCGNHCVYSHLDSRVWARHMHQEWTPDLRQNR